MVLFVVLGFTFRCSSVRFQADNILNSNTCEGMTLPGIEFQQVHRHLSFQEMLNSNVNGRNYFRRIKMSSITMYRIEWYRPQSLEANVVGSFVC
jgi:hypothetical protein